MNDKFQLGHAAFYPLGTPEGITPKHLREAGNIPRVAVNHEAALAAALRFVLSNETHRRGSEYEKARAVLAAYDLSNMKVSESAP